MGQSTLSDRLWARLPFTATGIEIHARAMMHCTIGDVRDKVHRRELQSCPGRAEGQALEAPRMAAAKPGRPRSTIWSDAVRLMRNQPGSSTIEPGRTSTLCRLRMRANAWSSASGARATT